MPDRQYVLRTPALRQRPGITPPPREIRVTIDLPDGVEILSAQPLMLASDEWRVPAVLFRVDLPSPMSPQ